MEDQFGILSRQIGSIASSLITTGSFHFVPAYDGKASKLHEWTQELEKLKSVFGLSETDLKTLAWSRAKGTVSTFLGRLLTEQPEITWPQVKAELEKTFGHVVDQQMAFSLLRNVKQDTGEDIHSYAEKLLQSAKKAYKDEWNPRDPLTSHQMIGLFLDGLSSYELKVKIYKEKPTTLSDAIELAKQEDASKKRFRRTPGRIEEPMEKDHRRLNGCYSCGGPHQRRHCPKDRRREDRPNKISVIQNPPMGTDRTRDQWQNQSRETQQQLDWRLRRCFLCHRPGHMARDCRANLN